MTSLIVRCKRHPKYGYPVITGSLAVQLTADDYTRLAPAQRGFINKARRAAGLDPFVMTAGKCSVRGESKGGQAAATGSRRARA
jgi:hypothetical protein